MNSLRRLSVTLSLVIASTVLAQTGSLFDPENARVTTENFPRAKRSVDRNWSEGIANPLTKQNGPYLIKVASFVGEGHKDYAVQLCAEIRESHRIPAYVFRYQHQVEGLMSEDAAEKFGAEYGTRPRRQVPLTEPPLNWVVLAGDFPSPEDPKAQKLLARVRKLNIQSVPPEIWAQYRIAATESLKGKGQKKSPLSSALIVPNPHPEAAKLGKQVPAETIKMIVELNAGSPYSIYENRHPFTLAVAQFQGGSTFGDKKRSSIFGEGKLFEAEKSPLNQAAQQAISVAEALRNLGWEAYVFHGQYASLVCVGGFDDIPDERGEVSPDLRVRHQLLNQHHSIAEMREKLAKVTIGGMTLTPHAELILTPSPPAPGATIPVAN